jgi:DNA-binding GntR family transcriptional regulator
MSHFARLESVGLKQQVQARLKQAILDGALAPGEQLVEGEIARQFGVSRSPVREAIQDLERQGYVVKKPRRGTFVTDLNPQSVVEIYSLRILLEGYAAAIVAAKRPADTVERLRALVGDMEEAMRNSNLVGFSEADLEFHSLLCHSTGHVHLVSLTQCLRPEMGFHIVLSRYSLSEIENLIRQHSRLLDAIEAGQSAEARLVVQEHIRWGGSLFLQKFFGADELALADDDEARIDGFWKGLDSGAQLTRSTR